MIISYAENIEILGRIIALENKPELTDEEKEELKNKKEDLKEFNEKMN